MIMKDLGEGISIFTWDIGDADGIVFIGDIHGEYGVVLDTCNKVRKKILVCCGDCGMGFANPGYYDNQFRKMNHRLEKTDNRCVFIRGNHDDPNYFEGKAVGGWTPDDYPRIHMADRGWEFLRLVGSELKACVLCGGGAVSVDRTMRVDGVTWWNDEGIVRADPKEMAEAAIQAAGGIGSLVIATHSSPSLAEPLENKGVLTGWASVDSDIIRDCSDEREYLTGVARELCSSAVPVDGWWYGHFHKSYRGVMSEEKGENENGVSWRCRYYGLDINEKYAWPGIETSE